jgi:ATP adenylyltransferase
MELLKQCLSILRKQYNPQGFNTGMNLGRSAGAGVTHHYHLHIIPRWTGDANFMPLIGKTKVVLEDLHTTYDHLLAYFLKKDKR